MRQRPLLWFVAPSAALIAGFIALPLTIVGWRSVHQRRAVFETTETERCTPGFPDAVCVTETTRLPALGPDGAPVRETVFVGADNFSAILAPERVAAALSGEGVAALTGVDFYDALRFTLVFTLLTQPVVIALGLAGALAVEAALARLRTTLIFVSLLPFIVTPVVGALSVRWLFVGDGVLTRLLEAATGRDLALFADAASLEALLMLYRVWSTTPFAFIVFYAGLRAVDRSLLEAAMVDGASRWARFRWVTLPALAPLLIFVTLIGLMDGYRVFEEIVGFSSAPLVISLQWITVDFLTPDETGNRALGRAAASAVLTVAGVLVLLLPGLMRFRRDYGRRRA